MGLVIHATTKTYRCKNDIKDQNVFNEDLDEDLYDHIGVNYKMVKLI